MDDTALPITGLRKPPKGQMCSGCGYCCTAQPCALAVELLSCVEGPCVALEQDDGRTFCGLVRRPVHYLLKQQAPPADTGALSVHFASMLGLGLAAIQMTTKRARPGASPPQPKFRCNDPPQPASALSSPTLAWKHSRPFVESACQRSNSATFAAQRSDIASPSKSKRSIT